MIRTEANKIVIQGEPLQTACYVVHPYNHTCREVFRDSGIPFDLKIGPAS